MVDAVVWLALEAQSRTMAGRRGGRRRAGRPGDRAAAADCVAELSKELAELARRHGLDALGYLLDMARLGLKT
jgi:hypothetical protein